MKKAVTIFIILFYLLTNSFPASADEKMDRQWQDETIYSIMVDRFHNADQSNDYMSIWRIPLPITVEIF